jgi:hypothetical protein
VSISTGREKGPWHATKSLAGARLQKGKESKGKISSRISRLSYFKTEERKNVMTLFVCVSMR